MFNLLRKVKNSGLLYLFFLFLLFCERLIVTLLVQQWGKQLLYNKCGMINEAPRLC